MPFEIKKWTFLVILGILLLSACSGQTSAEPTADPDTIYTQAAMTVEAQLTEAAESNPTQTETAAPPTEAVTSTATGEMQEEQETTPGQPLATSTPFALATFTATAPPPTAQAKYELISQNPGDGAVLSPNYKFDMIWTIKNIGTETWTEEYSIEFFIGDRMGGDSYPEIRYNFRKVVEPGDTIEVFVDMMTSSTAGEYYSWWKLKDEYGNNFGDVDVTLVVSD